MEAIMNNGNNNNNSGNRRPNPGGGSRPQGGGGTTLNTSALNPYHFVPVEIDLAVADKPVWHDGSSNREEELFSGELLCTMKTLTPTLVGNYHYEKEISIGNEKVKKTVVEPLRLADGRVIIPGTSIKGMLRHSLSALLSAPMERVQEQTFSYRPNSQLVTRKSDPILSTVGLGITKFLRDEKGRVKTIEAELCENMLKIGWKKRSEGRYFTNEFDHKTGTTQKAYFDSKPGYKKYNYFGSVDIDALLMSDFYDGDKEPYDAVAFPESRTKLMVDEKIYQHFLKTLHHLADTEKGHISSRHPQVSTDKKKGKVSQKELSKGYRELIDIFTYGTDDPVALFAEIDENQNVITMGHHFRYRWMYKDSIMMKDCALRKELSPQDYEITLPPELLTAARLLFGYTEDEKNLCTKGIAGGGKKNNLKHLAGRIAINHALESDTEKKDGDKFISPTNSSSHLLLKILGEPKASAVENYLSQNNIGLRKDGGLVCTYGDDLNDKSAGYLNGRKFYIHQPSAANSRSTFEAGENEMVGDDKPVRKSELASAVQCVSNIKTEFKFSVKYKNLRPWELDLLRFVLSLDSEQINHIGETPQYLEYVKKIALENKQEMFAHKIGYAKPLGFGSIKITVDNTLPESTVGAFGNFLKSKLGEKHKNWVQKVFISWLKVHQFADRTTAKYPVKFDIASKKETIHAFHSDIRNRHIKGRKLKIKDGSAMMLKPLPDSKK